MTEDRIRQATEQDIPALVDIGRRFYALTTIKDIKFCEQSVGMMLKTLIKGENSVVFVKNWAKNKGVSLFQMMALESPESKRLENIYKRRGYVPVERIFVKAL
jgi:hypothetical protein